MKSLIKNGKFTYIKFIAFEDLLLSCFIVYSSLKPDLMIRLRLNSGRPVNFIDHILKLTILFTDVCAKDITFLYYRQRICELCFEDNLKNDASALKVFVH